MTGLQLRVASALVAFALICASYYFGGSHGLAFTSALVMIRVLYEYARLHFNEPIDRIVFCLVSVLALMAMFFGKDNPITILFAVSFLTFYLFFRARSRKVEVEDLHFQFLVMCFGVFYCVWLPLFVLKALYWGANIFWFVFFLFLVFLGDTAAYFAGIKFGKHKLIEVISPKKTIEGSIAALVFTTSTSVGVGLYLSKSPVAFLILGVATSLLAQSGDLVESLIKRASHVKDSGQIMPGHGGMMDRLDGVYWAAPFFYWFLTEVLA